MPKYFIGCEGASQDEFYDFLLDIAQKIDWAMHPWEQPIVKKEMDLAANVERRYQGPCRGEAKTDEAAQPVQTTETVQTVVETIATDTILPGVEEKQTSQVEETAGPTITADELQNKCLLLGNKFGKQAFKELKAKAGFESMSKLDAQGRANFAAMIDQYMEVGHA